MNMSGKMIHRLSQEKIKKKWAELYNYFSNNYIYCSCNYDDYGTVVTFVHKQTGKEFTGIVHYFQGDISSPLVAGVLGELRAQECIFDDMLVQIPKEIFEHTSSFEDFQGRDIEYCRAAAAEYCFVIRMMKNHIKKLEKIHNISLDKCSITK